MDDWVEEHCGEEFAARHPELAPPEGGGKEPEAARRARDMRVRIALSDLKSAMRKERRVWLERELTALLSEEVEEDLPVRLGSYDADRGEYPLLLGFGWPTVITSYSIHYTKLYEIRGGRTPVPGGPEAAWPAGREAGPRLHQGRGCPPRSPPVSRPAVPLLP